MHDHTKSHICWYRIACCFLFFILIFLLSLMSGCKSRKSQPFKEKRDATPLVLIPEASGTVIFEENNVMLDASHTSDGYVMLKYTGSNEKVKFQIKAPDGTEYTYLVTEGGGYSVYPLSGGDGSYQFTLLEAVSTENNLYAVVFTRSMEAAVSDEFSPFLYPNHYVNFSADSRAVTKAQELAENSTSDLEAVSAIYHYVIQNISYDTKKAEQVVYGYTPDVDATLESGKGICFDYAALMTAMLRSQRIPTRLEVGYVGEVYHAWISCYVEEAGWVDDIIEFDGKSWSLMDPALGANNERKSVKKYIGDGSRYVVKYTY